MPLASSHTYVSSGNGIQLGRTSTGNESLYYAFDDFVGIGVIRDNSFTATKPYPDFTNGTLFNVPNGIDVGSTGWTRDYPSQVKFNTNIPRYALKINTTPINNQYIRLPNNSTDSSYDPLGSPLGDFTVACWLKTTKIGQFLIQGATSLSAFGFGIRLINLAVELYINGTFYTISIPNISDGNWHHLAVMRSGSNWSVYVDGVSYSGIATNTTLTLLTDSVLVGVRYDVFSGTPTFNINESFTGTLTELRIFRSAISGGQVSALASGLDLALYSNSLVANSYHYNSDNTSSPTIDSTTISIFELNYIASGGITVSGELDLTKRFFYTSAVNPISASGAAIIKRLTYHYIPKRTSASDSIFVGSKNLISVTRHYNATGLVFTVDPLVPQFSSAKVRRGQTLSTTGEILVSGETVNSFSPFIKINFNWHTSVEQIAKRVFSWNTGKLRKYYYRVVSKCLSSCPPLELDCDVNITTIVPATSISDRKSVV